ncbi:MAG: hypothetical protein Ct9H300mP19_19420 [Dehalococcoidia bacterium]|nr:MAG: hypothetical protein Ct9H300mP19_19420 [Dehalococcoidia bacterium]
MGGPVRNKVISYPHTQGKTIDELVANSVAAVKAGWKFVRWGQPETGGEFEGTGISTLEPLESIKLQSNK